MIMDVGGQNSEELRAAVPGIRGKDHVELVERLHQRFKKLDPVPQFKATAKLGGFLAQLPN